MFFSKIRCLFQLIMSILSYGSLMATACFAAIHLSVFGGVLYWLGLNDQGKNPKYLLLAVIAILIWSWELGILFRHKIMRSHLLMLAIPPLFIIMEFFNFTGITKLAFYCQIYHYIFYGSLLLALDIFIRDVLKHSSLRPFLQRLLGVFLVVLLLFPFLLITNIFLNATGIDHDAMIAICQTDQNEAMSYFLSNNGILFLAWFIFR